METQHEQADSDHAEKISEQVQAVVTPGHNRSAQPDQSSKFFLWGVDCVDPALGQKIVYEEVGQTTEDNDYNPNWYASREEPPPIMPITQDEYGEVLISKLTETIDEEMVSLREARPDIRSMTYKLAVVRLNNKSPPLREALRNAAEAQYHIYPALLVGIRVPAPHRVSSELDGRERVVLGDLAKSIRGRLVAKLLAIQPPVIYRMVMFNMSEWYEFDPENSDRVRGFNVNQEKLFSVGRREAASAGMDFSQVKVLELIKWKPKSWADRLSRPCDVIRKVIARISDS